MFRANEHNQKQKFFWTNAQRGPTFATKNALIVQDWPQYGAPKKEKINLKCVFTEMNSLCTAYFTIKKHSFPPSKLCTANLEINTQ